MSNENLAVICHIAAQRGGVTFCGIDKYPKFGRVAIFQHPATESSFAISIGDCGTKNIINRVRTQSFLLVLSWWELVDITGIKYCEKCGSYYSDECPNECPEQEYCACGCGAKHDDHDDSEGYRDSNGEWFCDDCKDECPEYLAEKAEHDREAYLEMARGDGVYDA